MTEITTMQYEEIITNLKHPTSARNAGEHVPNEIDNNNNNNNNNKNDSNKYPSIEKTQTDIVLNESTGESTHRSEKVTNVFQAKYEQSTRLQTRASSSGSNASGSSSGSGGNSFDGERRSHLNGATMGMRSGHGHGHGHGSSYNTFGSGPGTPSSSVHSTTSTDMKKAMSLGEFQEAILKLNPSSVEIDNSTDPGATVIRIDSANRAGVLLEVIQTLVKCNLVIKKARISSDGGWFVDDFHVTDRNGSKIWDKGTLNRIERMMEGVSFTEKGQDLPPRHLLNRSQNLGLIEIVDLDRPGMLSQVLGVASSMNLDVCKLTQWSYKGRVAIVITVRPLKMMCTTQEVAGEMVDGDYTTTYRDELKYQLSSIVDKSYGCVDVHTVLDSHEIDEQIASAKMYIDTLYLQSRLHFLLHFQIDLESYFDSPEHEKRSMVSDKDSSERVRVNVETESRSGYKIIKIVCRDRPSLFFDTLCAMNNLGFDIYHATIDSDQDASTATQEYFVRHVSETVGSYGPDMKTSNPDIMREHLTASVIGRRPEGESIAFTAAYRPFIIGDIATRIKDLGINIAAMNYSSSIENDKIDVEVFVTSNDGNAVTKTELANTLQRLREAGALSPSSSYPTSCQLKSSTDGASQDNPSFFDFSILQNQIIGGVP